MRKVIYGALAAVAIMTAAGCANSKQTQNNDGTATADSTALYREWNLVELEGQAVDTSTTAHVPTILFTQDGHRVSGHAGCNRMMGSFTFSGSNQIKLGPMASTKMACPDMKMEDAYLKALDKVDNYSFENGNLLLNNEKTPVAKFAAK
ncbi:META domain-containing protein [Chitinophaga defluvii]|uniref:META domain-containing protein n=1 Tax=Chitinophaga defluvii TaxID=3163343 RepID=A0ABV2T326_9BACT